MAAESSSDTPSSTLPGRIARLVSKVGKQYVDNAKRELRGDAMRLMVGVSFLFLMGVFGVHTVIFAHVTLIVVLNTLGLPLWGVVGAVFVGDALFVLFCAIMARFLLLKPLLPKTRRQIAHAWHFIAG